MKRSAGRAALILAIAAVFVFAATLAAGCSGPGPRQPQLDRYDLLVENRDAVAAQIQLQDLDGDFSGFEIPANSWAWVPGSWVAVHTVDETCETVSAGGVPWGGRKTRLFVISMGLVGSYDDDSIPLPTVGPLASPIPSDICPRGPHYYWESPRP